MAWFVKGRIHAWTGQAHAQGDGSWERDTEALLDRVREAQRSLDRVREEAERAVGMPTTGPTEIGTPAQERDISDEQVE